MSDKQKRCVTASGQPGRMATQVAQRILEGGQYRLALFSLTGQEITSARVHVGEVEVGLIRPNEREAIKTAWELYPGCIAIDFTHPSAVTDNVRYYCDHNIPFIMGTTGGDENEIRTVVETAGNIAVYSPNMAHPIVGLMAFLGDGAGRFPGLYKGWSISVVESHQAGKPDPSGTGLRLARDILTRFGALFSMDRFKMVRDPAEQVAMGVPEEYLSGHGWHTYKLVRPDGLVEIIFGHNVLGRQVYVDGTMLALDFLNQKVEAGITGRLYTMEDVISEL